MSVRILLPPSEGKAPGGSGPAWAPGTMVAPGLDDARLAVARALAAEVRSPDRAARLLGVTGPTLARAVADDRAVLASPTLPAYQRYTGVVWSALAPAELRARQRGALLVFSGLWGVLGANDPVPAYRLKMSASMTGIGRLSRYWSPLITAELAGLLAGATVFDLLPVEHSAGWDPGAVPYRRRVRVAFEELRPDGSRRVVSHNAKALKGALARYLLDAGARSVAAVADFSHGGYRFDSARSDLTGRDALACFTAPSPDRPGT